MRLHERWVRWRNARLADPRFQRWASRFPLTRPIARRQAAALFDTVAGFVYSQILAACVRLDLFRMIGTGSVDAATLSRDAGLPAAAAETLLKAAAAIGLLEAVGGERFALGPKGAALLGNPGIVAMIRHHHMLYADLADPVALLRRGNGSLADFWRYGEGGTPEAVAAYSELMAASQAMVSEQILDAYDFGQHRHLLDIGGGEGAFVAAVASKHPALKLSLFDLPAVAERARTRLGDRVAVFPGSFTVDAIPQGADIVSLVRILHDHDDDVVISLLRAVYKSLPTGGTILIAEPMARTAGAEAMGHAYFGLYLLAMGSGRPRTASELCVMLENAGFRSVREVSTALPLVTYILTATR